MPYHPDKPTKATVYSWVSAVQIPVHKGGKKLRFLKSEIDTWLKQGKKLSNQDTVLAAHEYLTYKKG
ncbi:MAG: helix-turn-helix domain-containing protein [Saprospiraceae bacterium]|nr:helix-turn-helix domain-containing protein [Saprospiraceae bacterium]